MTSQAPQSHDRSNICSSGHHPEDLGRLNSKPALGDYSKYILTTKTMNVL